MTSMAAHKGFLRVIAVLAVAMPLSLSIRAGEAADKLDGSAWLRRIASAAHHLNFQGTMVVSTGGSSVSTSRVARYCQGRDSFEHHESLDGPPRLIYRHNQLVHTLWPAKKMAVIEQRDALMPFPVLPEGAEALSAYDVRLEGSDRIAAHPSQVMLLQPRDASTRYAQRLWADVGTGLMLRADILDGHGRVLESMAFTDLKTGIRPQPEAVTTGMQKLEGYEVVKADITRTKLEGEGWKLDVPVTGFRQISCVKRPVGSVQARPQAPMIVQSVFSDGLVHVSVFIEPFDASRHDKPKMSSWGASNTLTQQRGDAWVTVMGDVPMETVKRFATALERLR